MCTIQAAMVSLMAASTGLQGYGMKRQRDYAEKAEAEAAKALEEQEALETAKAMMMEEGIEEQATSFSAPEQFTEGGAPISMKKKLRITRTGANV